MPDPANTSQRLESLKARWDSDRGSRVFLQLADEYRRLGRLEDAAKVLEEGLQAWPGHLGARVARGRCLIELGRAGGAVGDLEKVIQADPTQMVAYRLLVQAYIQTGDAKTASERLRVYSLLNVSDPEIEELSAQIEALESGGLAGGLEAGAGPTPPQAETPPPAPPAPAAEAGGAEQVVQPAAEPAPAAPTQPPSPPQTAEPVEQAFESALPSELPPLRMPSAGEEPRPREGALAESREDVVQPETPAPEAAEPFPEVGAPEPPVVAPEASAAVSEVSAAAPEPWAAASGASAAAPGFSAAEPAGGPTLDPFPALGLPEDEGRYLASVGPDLLGGAPETEALPSPVPEVVETPSVEIEVEEHLFEAVEGEPGTPAGPAAEAAPAEPFEAAEPFEIEPAGLDVGAPTADELAEVEGAEPFDLAPPASAAPAPFEELLPEEAEATEPTEPGEPIEPPREVHPPREEGGATVTLGRLYLRQGHLQEAEAIFREILARDPDDPEAQAGLEEVAAQAGAVGLEGKDLLVGFDGGSHGEGLTARKRYALERYLALIRGSGSDVH